MTITPHNDSHLLLSPQSFKDEFSKLTLMPAFHKWVSRSLLVRIVGANINYILQTWPNASWVGGAEDVRARYVAESAKAEETAKVKKGEMTLVDDSGYQYARSPLPHQKKGFLLSRDAEEFALLMEQGTGKTKIIIDTACYLFLQGKIEMLIVIAWPNGVHHNWVDYEMPLDMSVIWQAAAWTDKYKTKKKQAEFAKVINSPDSVLKSITFNIEAFVSEEGKKFLLMLLKKFKCLLVIDQSASIKNPQSKRAKFIINKASELAPYRRIMDGAPCSEGAQELYAQFKFLSPDIIGHDTWTGFKAEFCKTNFFGAISGYRNLPELYRRIDGYSYRCLASECQDLPAKVYRQHCFELSEEERAIYDDLRDRDIAFFTPPGREVGEGLWNIVEMMEEHHALVKMLRLQQVASGWWPVDGVKQINPQGIPSRCSAILSLLESWPGEKAIIFSRFRPDLDLLAKVLGKRFGKGSHVSLHGGVNGEDRRTAMRQFKEDPKCLYLLGQHQTAGLGYTFTEAKHIIFYANDHSLRLREECEKRAHRQGLKHQLNIWDIQANDTADGKIIRRLRSKKLLSEEILQDPKMFFLEYEN